jgi:hypothetical protein
MAAMIANRLSLRWQLPFGGWYEFSGMLGWRQVSL